MSEEELNKLCEEKWGFSFTELAKIKEELFDWVVILKSQKAEKQEKIDKVIEYIKELEEDKGIWPVWYEQIEPILEILGGNKEND